MTAARMVRECTRSPSSSKSRSEALLTIVKPESAVRRNTMLVCATAR